MERDRIRSDGVFCRYLYHHLRDGKHRPHGIHTGESVVVAPILTLRDDEFQMMRSAAIKIIRALDVQGGCNIQFAYNNGTTMLSR